MATYIIYDYTKSYRHQRTRARLKTAQRAAMIPAGGVLLYYFMNPVMKAVTIVVWTCSTYLMRLLPG